MPPMMLARAHRAFCATKYAAINTPASANITSKLLPVPAVLESCLNKISITP